MSFTGHEDHSIGLEEAADLTRRFRDNNQGAILGGFFGRDAIESILAQTGCVGIRYYNAEKDNNDHTLVLVGCDANQNDILPGIVQEFAKPIPPYGGNSNVLNT
jgi:hypothetical protein